MYKESQAKIVQYRYLLPRSCYYAPDVHVFSLFCVHFVLVSSVTMCSALVIEHQPQRSHVVYSPSYSVLGADKSEVLPRSCKIASTSQNKSFMSRLSHLGDTPDIGMYVDMDMHSLAGFSRLCIFLYFSPSFLRALTYQNTNTAGCVSINECHNLNDTLKMMPGGVTFLPSSCNAMLEKEHKTLAEKYVCLSCLPRYLLSR